MPPNPAPLRVIQITDMHLHDEPGARLRGSPVDDGLQAVLQWLQQRHWPADLMLATGDLIHEAGEPAYRRLRDYLEPLGVPVYCLPGNHDMPGILAAALADGLVRRQRHVLAGAWQFLLLDSTVAGSEAGHLDPTELAFLASTLAAYPDRHAMICLHHQPLDIGSAWLDTMTVDNGADLFALLDQHPQVRAVVWGHIHQTFASRRGGVELLGTPATCIQFRPGLATPEPDDLPPGYRWFELYEDGAVITGVEHVAAAGS